MSQDTLILISQNQNKFFQNNSTKYVFEELYSGDSFLYRIIRKIILQFDLPFKAFVFGKWFRNIDLYSKIILFDTGNAVFIARYLRRCLPQKRIIVWYWNSIKDSVDPMLFKNIDIELWTFDPEDAEKYKMKLNTQFYIPSNIKIEGDNHIDYDVFYVGADKNRTRYLAKIRDILDRHNKTYNFNLVQYRGSKNDYGIEYKPSLEYEDVIKNCIKSRAIIDLVADWQTGLTLRPIEAMVLKKKLITNMISIKEFDFYNKNNIFIIGLDNDDELCSFIDSDFDMTNYEKNCNYYSVNEWLERFELK